MGLFKRFLDNLSSPQATAEALLTQYARFEHLSEGERLLKLFTTRGGWKEIPEETLRHLIELLGKAAESHEKHILEVIALVVAGEACKVERVLAVPNHSVSERVGNAAMVLAMRSDALSPQWREKALELSGRLAPGHPFVMVKRAIWHYGRGEYVEALHLFRDGVELVEEMHERTKALTDLAPADTIPEEWDEVQRESETFLSAVKAMYEDCQRRVQ